MTYRSCLSLKCIRVPQGSGQFQGWGREGTEMRLVHFVETESNEAPPPPPPPPSPNDVERTKEGEMDTVPPDVIP